jgi:hypothetical protein
LSSFWLILKQQWTIKISSPLFLFLAWRPSWLEVGITGHNFGRGPSKGHSTKVWFKLAQWFQRSWLKCEKLTDGRTTDDGRSVVTIAHMTLWVRWANNTTFWLFIQIILIVFGVTKTITVPFGCLLRLL